MLNPDKYLHIDEVEAGEMKLDKNYDILLSKQDVERIINLPFYIQAALPFLNNQHEVYCHKLLQQFSFGRDENFFRLQDSMAGNMESSIDVIKTSRRASFSNKIEEVAKIQNAEDFIEKELRLRCGMRIRNKVDS